MIRTDIPRQQWGLFCDQFSRQHRGWIVNLGSVDSGVFDSDPESAEPHIRPMASPMPLETLLVAHRGDELQLLVTAGERPEHVTHVVRRPEQLRFEQTDEGEHRGLTIATASGETILLRFRVPARPEVLDGIAEAEP